MLFVLNLFGALSLHSVGSDAHRHHYCAQAFHIFYPNEDQSTNATLATLAEEISQCGVGHIAGSWLCQWCEERHARWRGRCERCIGPPLLRFLLFLLSLIVVPLGLTLARCRLLLGDEMCSRRRIQEAMAKQRALAMQSLQSLRRAASHATTNVKRATMNAASFGKGLLQQAGGDILLDVTSGAGGRCCPVPSKQCWRACGEKTKEVRPQPPTSLILSELVVCVCVCVCVCVDVRSLVCVRSGSRLGRSLLSFSFAA